MSDTNGKLDVLYWQAFLEWNRGLPEPLVEIGAEYAVAQVAARLRAEVAELRDARLDITTEMVNALAPYLKDWHARPMDYERGAKAIRAVLEAALKGKL